MRIYAHFQTMLLISMLVTTACGPKHHHRKPQRRIRQVEKNAENCGILLAGDSKQRGTGIAVQAAQEAAKANDEMSAAVLTASRQIKLQYAEKAAAAAKAAEAATLGKQQILEQLEYEVREAEIIVQEETETLSSAESNMHLAFTAARQAKQELKMIKDTLKLAQKNYEISERVAEAGQISLADKNSVLQAAKSRVGVLMWQCNQARNDLQKTKQAANRASSAAREAKERIDRQRRMSRFHHISHSKS